MTAATDEVALGQDQGVGTKRVMPPPPRARSPSPPPGRARGRSGSGTRRRASGAAPRRRRRRCAGAVETAGLLYDGARLAVDADVRVLDDRRSRGHRRERLRSRGRRRRVGHVDLDPEAADPLLELVGGAVGDHPAVDDHDPVGEAGPPRRGTASSAAPSSRRRPGPRSSPRARAGCAGRGRSRLVEEDDRRIGDEGGGDRAGGHAAGVGLDDPLARVGQAEALEELVGALARILAVALP